MNYMDDASTFERSFLQKARQQHIPITGALELLPLCNMNCDMCYVRLSRSEMECQGQLRTVDEWILLAQQMQKAGTLFLLLTGGEPLLFPDFKTLYRRLRNLGMILTINTNGTLLDEAWADFFATYPPHQHHALWCRCRFLRPSVPFSAGLRSDPSRSPAAPRTKRGCENQLLCNQKESAGFFQDFCPRKRARCPCPRRSLYDARRPGTLPSF